MSGYILIQIDEKGETFFQRFFSDQQLVAYLDKQVEDGEIRDILPQSSMESGAPGCYVVRGDLIVPQRTGWQLPTKTTTRQIVLGQTPF